MCSCCFFALLLPRPHANWRKVQDLGLKEVYGQEMKTRTLIKSLASLAAISRENVFRSSLLGKGKSSRNQKNVWNTSRKLGSEVLVVLVKVNRCFQPVCNQFGDAVKDNQMINNNNIEGCIERSNWAWGSITQR